MKKLMLILKQVRSFTIGRLFFPIGLSQISLINLAVPDPVTSARDADERKKILRKIEIKNEEISQKNETHRHKLCEIHEAYKLEIQKENERHVEDLKVTETSIRHLKTKLEDLQQLNYSISRKIPTTEVAGSSSGR